MADVQVNNPELLREILGEVESIKATFVALKAAHESRPTRGKYGNALTILDAGDLPLMELGASFDKNDSQASMQQQFNKAAEKMSLSWEPSVVFYNGAKFLVNFDHEQAEEKFENYILSKAGIDKQTLASITRDLDDATK
mgnify:CR=1 FL=1